MQTQKADLKDGMATLRKDMENMERHLSKYGRDCNTLEEELTKLEELHTHENFLWIKVSLWDSCCVLRRETGTCMSHVDHKKIKMKSHDKTCALLRFHPFPVCLRGWC